MRGPIVRDEDIDWVERWQAGDETALTALVNKYRERVRAVAYRFLQNRTEAEDIAQETFIRLVQARDRYRPSAKFSSYLFTIANRLCLNALRHRKRHPAQSLEAPVSADPEAPARQWADPAAVPAAQVLEEEEQSLMVRRAVDRLPPDERMALILDHWEDQPLERIAEVLRKSIPAVKSLLFRARAKLRISLAAYVQK
ncbi:MAG: sigma-70 family RNA polymerase sigma factor [candidate division FCPU426 bacterium]